MTEPTLDFVDCPDSSGGHRMAYWAWGDAAAGHVVLCVHGLSRQGRDFDVLAAALCESARKLGRAIRVVCPDVAGRGESEWLKDPTGYQVPYYAADMRVLLAHLQAKAPITALDWVGTSMGGLIGIVVAGMPPGAPGLPAGIEAVPAASTGPPQARPAPSGGSEVHEVTSVGAMSCSAGPPQARPAPSGGSALNEVKNVGASSVRRLVLNDVGPAIEWQAIVRIGAYLGRSGEFTSVQEAADAMWAVSSGFGPHTAEQWLALSRHMVKPVCALASAKFRLHYDPAIAVPFGQSTEETTLQGEAMLWQLYDNIKAKTLLLRGAGSDLLNPQTAQAMTQRGPRAELVEFAGVGHAPTLVAADQVAAVANFLLA
jgi:pimeloyl-ACP methyl ester carboxylesterase